MSLLDEREEHKENYMGKVSWYRTSGGAHNLYGTEIKTDHPVCLSICESSESRHLSKTWYHTDKQIIEIEMSSIQWAEFLTSGNTEGVPCTILYRDGKQMDEVPNSEVIRQYAEESKDVFDEFRNGADSLYAKVKEAYDSGKPMGRKQMEELLNQIKGYRDRTIDNVNFVRDSFEEDMNHIVVKAKSEVNAYVETKALELGMEDLKNGIQLSIENKKE